LGIVEILMLGGGLAQEPSPTAFILPDVDIPCILVMGSSLPIPVSLLVAGDVDDRAK
jgi:hypothetical protein